MAPTLLPAPRAVWTIDLAALAAGGSGTSLELRGGAPEGGPSSALEDGLAALGGPAPPTLVLAVGDAVRRGVPTAARATLLARVPTTGRLADGQLGGALGARLAGRADVVLLRGHVPAASGAVLVLDLRAPGAGVARLAHHPDLAGLAPREVGPRLRAALGDDLSGVTVGSAGEAGAPLANVAGLDAPTSFVGRGGLGVALGATGLKALAVLAPDRPAGAPEDGERGAARALRAALERSPRLVARAEGGTFELADELEATGASGAGAARRAADDAAASRAGRHGCRGCPTPCGWVLDGGAGSVRGARFGALAHLAGAAEAGERPVELLARCDDLGLDAKGATFVLSRIGGGAERLERLAAGAFRAEQMAAVLDGRAPDRPGGPLEELARRVAGLGRDPMRVGLALASADAELMARSLAPLPAVPVPGLAAGLGRSVWWHECLAAALDATGFCAFSAAGLLADGVLELDELAAQLLPAEPPAGAPELIELGARVVRARHALGAGRLARLDPAEVFEAPGALPEYRACAGLDADGRPVAGAGTLASATAALGGAESPAGRSAAARAGGAGDAPRPVTPAGPGEQRVELRAGPALRARLAGAERLRLALPAPLAQVLAAAEAAAPSAHGWLLRGAELVPAVHRDGARLGAHDEVRDGDCLDLVLVVSGG